VYFLNIGKNTTWKMMVKLATSISFTNILRAGFNAKKLQITNFKWSKAANNTFKQKKLFIKCW